MTTNWLPLIDYSTKHKISISTLRRKIKSNEIEFRLDNGKYLLKEMTFAEAAILPTHVTYHEATARQEEPVFSTATKILDELKKAYTFILQEKEEQICLLKDEMADLRTLVRVLEQENDRLKMVPGVFIQSEQN